MAFGNAPTRDQVVQAVVADAIWLQGVVQAAARKHLQHLEQLPDDQALGALGLSGGDISAIHGISYQLDRLQTLLGGTIPGSAADALADCAVVIPLGSP